METGAIQSTDFDSRFARRKFHQFSQFLQTLQEAREYVNDLQCSAKEFAIHFSEAESMGIGINDLVWMTRKGWIRAVNSETLGARVKESRLTPRRGLSRQSHFVIDDLGIDVIQAFSGATLLDHQDIDEVQTVSDSSKPNWDPDRHELTFHGRLVKRFRWPAVNQEVVLSAFQEEAWPSRIDDPLPGADDLEPKRRLSDTIKCLNRSQHVSLLRFRGDGTGEGIIWDIERESA